MKRHHVFPAPTSIYNSSPVKLLLHCDGTLASTAFPDSSLSNHFVAARGAAQVDTSQSEFGGASGLFGVAADYLALDSGSDFTFGTGDFTVDFWARRSTSTVPNIFIDFRDTNNQTAPMIYYDAGGLHYNCNAADQITYATTLTVGTWYHIAISRAGTSTKLFLNGTQVGSTYTASDNLICAPSGPTIGSTVVVSYQAETVSWAAAVVTAGGTVSAGRESVVDTLIAGLKTDGIWSKLDRLWLFAAENTQSALLDLVSRSTASVVGSPTFTANSGYAANGSSYINTNFNWATNGVTFVQNSAHISCWNLVDGADANPAIAGSGAAVEGIYPKYSDNTAIIRINDGASTGGIATIGVATGLFLGNRDSSTGRQAYQNGVSLGTYASNASQAPQSASMLAYTHSHAAVSAGGSLNSTDQLAFYNRLRTYMTAVGVP